mgnify:CR=1 FL=1
MQSNKKKKKGNDGVIKIKVKKTSRISGAAIAEENRIARGETASKQSKNVRAASESVNRKTEIETAYAKQKSPIPSDLSKSQTLKPANPIFTPRDSSTNAAKKGQYQPKKDLNGLAMPAISQTNPNLKKKEKTVLGQIGEEKPEKPPLKDKLPNFGLIVDRKPKEPAIENGNSKATTSLPTTTANKVMKSENPSDRPNVFTIKTIPSKPLPTQKNGPPKKLPEEQLSKSQVIGTPNTLGISTNTSEIISISRTFNNRAKSPGELLPGEKEKRRLAYAAPVMSNNYKVLFIETTEL